MALLCTSCLVCNIYICFFFRESRLNPIVRWTKCCKSFFFLIACFQWLVYLRVFLLLFYFHINIHLQEVLMEFRAGKMTFEGRRVVPDTRKGLVRIARVWSVEKKLLFVIFWFSTKNSCMSKFLHPFVGLGMKYPGSWDHWKRIWISIKVSSSDCPNLPSMIPFLAQ